jgi:hypothetical protein
MPLSINRVLLTSAVLIFVAFSAPGKDQPLLTVEVLKTETVHWTTYLHRNGSSGRTNTDCDVFENSVSCTSETVGERPPSDRPIYHTQVNLLVRMPDGNKVEMQCHYPPVWATCFQPELGSYAAKINGHNIHILIPVTRGKPKYSKDGTIKQSAKVETEEVKFSFR